MTATGARARFPRLLDDREENLAMAQMHAVEVSDAGYLGPKPRGIRASER